MEFSKIIVDWPERRTSLFVVDGGIVGHGGMCEPAMQQ
jgi:hypothetical protein